MSEKAVCKCGKDYVPQDYLSRIADQPSDRARCPACGQELCLATCACGQPLTSEHREVNPSYDFWIARSVVEFRCPACGRQQVVKLHRRKNRPVFALWTAVVMAAIGAGLAWWSDYPAELIVLMGAGFAVMGAASFYFFPVTGRG